MASSKFINIQRWFSLFTKTFPQTQAFLSTLPAKSLEKVSTKKIATKGKSNLSDETGTLQGKKSKSQKEVALCPPLPNVEKYQKIITRFPPEPSGHLHIGHCKALFLNLYYAKRYDGELLIRFDDTNPSKEKEEFEQGIVSDIKSLGISVEKITHTSDYFDEIKDLAIKLIKQGDAYMDNSDVEIMRKERDEGIDNKNRDNSVEENLRLFEEMYNATKIGQKYCLRAKMNMQDVNKCLRDPVLFRTNLEPHLQTKTKYKAYPTYDLACPIVDSIENVSHCLRDMNYKDRKPLYKWVCEKLSLREIQLFDFAKLNFVYTVMSKRKLKWFVENNYVKDWSDPRFPTVKGILRRGCQVQTLFDYMVSQGASKKVCDIEWDKFWNLNKKLIDPVVPRFMAVDANENVILEITNIESDILKTVPRHPKDEGGKLYGNKILALTREVLVERADLLPGSGLEEVKIGEKILLLQSGTVRVCEVKKNADGVIVRVKVETEPQIDLENSKRKIHWVPKSSEFTLPARIFEFDYLITKPVLEADDEVKDFVNEHSIAETSVLANIDLRLLKENDCLQLQRRGYYRVDKAYDQNSGSEIHLFTIPDGKQKAMSTFSTATSKMHHR